MSQNITSNSHPLLDLSRSNSTLPTQRTPSTTRERLVEPFGPHLQRAGRRESAPDEKNDLSTAKTSSRRVPDENERKAGSLDGSEASASTDDQAKTDEVLDRAPSSTDTERGEDRPEVGDESKDDVTLEEQEAVSETVIAQAVTGAAETGAMVQEATATPDVEFADTATDGANIVENSDQPTERGVGAESLGSAEEVETESAIIEDQPTIIRRNKQEVSEIAVSESAEDQSAVAASNNEQSKGTSGTRTDSQDSTAPHVVNDAAIRSKDSKNEGQNNEASSNDSKPGTATPDNGLVEEQTSTTSPAVVPSTDDATNDSNDTSRQHEDSSANKKQGDSTTQQSTAPAVPSPVSSSPSPETTDKVDDTDDSKIKKGPAGSTAKPVKPDLDATASRPDASAPRETAAGPSVDLQSSSVETDRVSPGDRVRFVQRVARAFQAQGPRGGQVTIRLSPPELGSLKIEITVHNGGLSAHLEAETHAARSAVLDHLPALRERLAEQHIKVEQFDVDVRDDSQGRYDQANTDTQQRPPEQGNRRAPRVQAPSGILDGAVETRSAKRQPTDGEFNVVV